jgi:hypothetical protein
MVRRECCDLVFRQDVPRRVSELFSDRRRPVCLKPHTLRDVEILEDREKGQPADFREMDQWAGVGDCG